MLSDHVDVLIIGAGISGICAGWHIRNNCPDHSFAILEARDSIGGTWDLFRYPGIRSDSDLFTFGYSFRPWDGQNAIAEGADIRAYLQRTANESGLTPHLFFNHKAVKADWDSKTACWRLDLETPDGPRQITAGFVFFCTGYYDYAQGHAPKWDGMAQFQGQILHPQFWPQDAVMEGKAVTVIGSGATAVTLAPALAELGARVTIVQRSPSYIAAMPGVDGTSNTIRRLFGRRAARWWNILMSITLFKLARKFPNWFTDKLRKEAVKQLGPDFDYDTHLTPTYAPWDQRVNVDKDGALFAALRTGQVDMVTGQISHFTKTGLQMDSGQDIGADVIITATGLKIQIAGGMQISVDGHEITPDKALMYKGMMMSDVPNAAYSIGYTNASWTLRAELIARHTCRLLNEMRKRGARVVTPIAPENSVRQPLLDLDAGYLRRAIADLPGQGAHAPWKVRQNYLLDLWDVDRAPISDPALKFD